MTFVGPYPEQFAVKVQGRFVLSSSILDSQKHQTYQTGHNCTIFWRNATQNESFVGLLAVSLIDQPIGLRYDHRYAMLRP
jgi:hypothetical protein